MPDEVETRSTNQMKRCVAMPIFCVDLNSGNSQKFMCDVNSLVATMLATDIMI